MKQTKINELIRKARKQLKLAEQGFSISKNRIELDANLVLAINIIEEIINPEDDNTNTTG